LLGCSPELLAKHIGVYQGGKHHVDRVLVFLRAFALGEWNNYTRVNKK
jgi:hypothetical protein